MKTYKDAINEMRDFIRKYKSMFGSFGGNTMTTEGLLEQLDNMEEEIKSQ